MDQLKEELFKEEILDKIGMLKYQSAIIECASKEYWTKVVWVPRKKVYYDRNRLDETSPEFKKAIEELVPTMIMGHLRRCENPNPKQLDLAREFGITPPVGYTFVRPHSRHVHKAELARFRPKSALEILYGQTADLA